MNDQNKLMKKTQQLKEALLAFPDEVAYYESVHKKIQTALSEATAKVEQVDKEYLNFKQYMSDYRGELDPHEMFQNSMILKQIDQSGVYKVDMWRKLEKIQASPYFARIDFQEEQEPNAYKIYIGRFSFMDDLELLIVDWRSPIASMFYDYELGPAGYSAPMGRIEGKLTRKRQFQIEDGELKLVLESSLHIQDTLLQQVLSHSADDQMKSIISTIQKEQNQIIRNELSKSIIIQGVAGSGKTSIALHRISYLLYRFKDCLTSKNVTILSPNKVFAHYISTVLPELGDEPIYESSFVEIAKLQLHGIINFEPDKDPLENDDPAWAKRVQYKSTSAFIKKIDTFLHAIAGSVFVAEDYSFQNNHFTADYIQEKFLSYRSAPFKKRLKLLAEDMVHSISKNHGSGITLPKTGMIQKDLNKMVKIKNSIILYKTFYRWLELPDMIKMPDKKTLEWADVYPFLYIHAAYAGLQESINIKHLVIDEMQDYTPVQYAIINRLFPCQKTILGDFGQSVHPNHRHDLHDILELYQDASFVELTKSYRSTYEIITFANTIQKVTKLDPMERHGEEPNLLSCHDEQALLTSLKDLLHQFLMGEFSSLGMIVKNQSYAQSLYENLSKDYEMNLITVESTSFSKGISITSIHMSKGLEFDEVILLDINDKQYHSEHERNLLYIAITRAMHKLTILYTDEPSRFLPS